ncbi:MAG TPA: hypothetical protein VJ935_01170, partial [Acidimicrobiia bacterium]|nr:hypothetical protein [Acidimicrobiia bacterium]
RQRTLQAAIEDLLVKERLDLPPQLRELDARVEQVELSLRRTVSTALNGSPAALPSHVRQKIEERIEVAAQKNPTFDAERYETLSGKLEYSDLREIEAVILNRSLWPSFQNRFGNKEAASHRFGQLAELRNGIRHSRTVDEVTRKEGEAAILWFEQILA